jgi:hypothetical protein
MISAFLVFFIGLFRARLLSTDYLWVSVESPSRFTPFFLNAAAAGIIAIAVELARKATL